MHQAWRFAVVGAAAVALSGCTQFSQIYHFQSAAPGNSIPNFFRVKVSGDAQTAKARYVAGFYDERAVDLFFNEVKSSADGEIRQPFVATLVEPGSDPAKKITPLTPEAGRGAFVMIFSTNPKAVADTIGNFAESHVVADAITNILNRREIAAARALSATGAVADEGAKAIADELAASVPATPAPGATVPDGPALTRAYLRVLETIARATGGPMSLSNPDAARAWLGRGAPR